MTKFEHADILDLLGGDIDDNAVMRLVFECLISRIDDDRVVSLMNLIGWRGSFSCFALGNAGGVHGRHIHADQLSGA